MNDNITIEDIDSVLARKVLIPSVVMWNRLEGRPRREDFLRALRAEIRDPLWMLCKQWQVGEFKGDDAGSPIFAKVHMKTTKLTRFQPGRADAQPFDNESPFETTVEKLPIQFFGQEQHILSMDIRLTMGRQWIKLLGTAGLATHKSLFVAHYDIEEPDPAERDDAFITAHATVWQSLSALAGRAMDGAKLYFHLQENDANRAYDGISVPGDDQPAIDTLAERFVTWVEGLFQQPLEGSNDAWVGEQLEYQFGVSAPVEGGDKVMVADEYYQGRLDWYNLDVDSTQNSLPGPAIGAAPDDVQDEFTQSFLPVNIQFDGMPNTRWWTFEDSRTNFGDIKPDTTDVNKLLLIEFGLVYANDWFLLPFQLPVGSLANVAGLAVTNVFGERTWVRAAGEGQDETWQRWSMYKLAVKGRADVAQDTTLVLLPTVPKNNDGKPLEDVNIIRDEVANMVWAVENSIPLPTGRSKLGFEAGKELAKRFETILDSEIDGGLVVPEVPEHAAAIRYQLMESVPENWVPMIPVHVDGDNREIQLQRASMPRIIIGDPNTPAKIKPRTSLLRKGLDETPAKPYFLHEEEVPRAGVRLTQGFQRTRWHDGRVYTWLAIRKRIGRGEGSSGLAFDRVKSTRRRLRPSLRSRD